MRQFTRSVAVFASLLLIASFVRAEDAPGKTLMWKVTGEGNEIYLLGSIHVMKKEIYPLAKELEDAFAKSKYLVVEAQEPDPATIQKMVMEKGMYAGDDTLNKHLTKPTQEALAAYLPKSGLPGPVQESLSKMKPWMVSITLSLMGMMQLGFDPQMGIDKHFLDEAKTAQKKVLELESADFQLTLLSGFSDDLQDKLLASTLLEVSSMKEQIEKMVAAWSKGDGAEMSKILTEHLVKHPELKAVFEKLIDERNAPMAAKVEGYLKSKEIHFVVAGAAHMVGEKGIVKLLQDKKYKVEQVMASGKKAELAPAK